MNANSAMKLLPREWKDELALLFRHATGDLIIVTPYFTSFGTQLLANNVSSAFSTRGRITFLTDLSPSNICAGAAQPAALIPLQTQALRLQVIHIPNLHAKVYVADNARAIVTSANFTGGGLIRNHEYGLLIEIEDIIAKIRRDIDELAALGTQLTYESLEVYAQIAENLVTKYERKLKSARTV
jgi:phosphatidylserine/phosphatidylglycerophosphate/cardiolipin synthase-like enzyme